MYEIACRAFLIVLADAVSTTIYLINRGPSSDLDGGIPEEA